MKKKVAVFLLFLIFLGSSWSLLNSKFFRVHDYTSGARIAEMTRALEDGHFPVRWTQNFGYGYGMPLFEFYGPLPFYIGSIFYWLTNNLVGSIKFLYLLSNLGTLAGAYLLGKEFAKRKGGVLAAAIITLAPYRALNLFIRGALNETWGLMALPWILWSLTKVIKGEKKFWPYLTLSVLVMVLSHNLTVLIAAPFILLYFLVLVIHLQLDKKIKIKFSSLIYIFWAGLTALMASCFYWLPSFAEKSFTKMEELILTGYFNFRLHFLYLRQFANPRWGFGGSSWGPDDNISFFLGYGQVFALFILSVFFIISLLMLLRRKEKFSNIFKSLAFLLNLLAIFLLSALLTTPKTSILWEKIDLMKYVQFPWRYMVVMVLLIGLLVAVFVDILQKHNQKLARLFCFLVFILTAINIRYFKPEKYTPDPADFYYADEEKIRTNMSDILPDYIPSNLANKITPSHFLISEELEGNALVKVEVNKTHEKLIQTNFKNEQNLTINLADYPGWKVFVDEDEVSKTKTDQGLIALKVPAGEHLISVIFSSTPIRFYADLISFVGLMLFLITSLNKNYFGKLIFHDK